MPIHENGIDIDDEKDRELKPECLIREDESIGECQSCHPPEDGGGKKHHAEPENEVHCVQETLLGPVDMSIENGLSEEDDGVCRRTDRENEPERFDE